MKALTLEDDGFFQLTYRRAGDPPDAKPVVLTLDTFEVYERLRGVLVKEMDDAEAGKRTSDVSSRMRDCLNAAYGLTCSGKFADDLYGKLVADVDEYKKKGRSPNSAETPAPSGSPSGPTDPQGTPPA